MVTAAIRNKETPYDISRWNFDSAVERLRLAPELRKLVSTPYFEVSFDLPARSAEGELRMVHASHALHSNARGPALASIRRTASASPELARALAQNATWTATVANVPFGGASAVLGIADSAEEARDHGTVRKYLARVQPMLGQYQCVLNLGDLAPSLAKEICDEVAAHRGFSPATIVGKPAERGGADGHFATAAGAALVLENVAAKWNRNAEGLTVAVHANRDSALTFAAEFAAIGCRVVSVSDGVRSFSDPRGISLLQASATLRGEYQSAGPADAALGCECDILLVASDECILDSTAVARVRAHLVLEAAHLNITPTADAALRQRGVMVVPDLLTCCGSVIGAYTEWSHNIEQLPLTQEKIRQELKKQVAVACCGVFARADRETTTWRVAANSIAIERVARTERLRGF